MAKYDITLKRLTDTFAADYVRFALGLERFTVEVIDVERVDGKEESRKTHLR